MAYSIKENLRNPIVQLREDLDKAERLAPQLNRDNIESFLQLLDRIDAQFPLLENATLDLRPEQSRQISLHSRLERLPNSVVSAAARAGGLAKLRAQNPPASGFWWHLDAQVAAERRQVLRRLLTTIGGLILFFGGIYFIVETFFPPDPNVLLVNDATNTLPDLAMQGRWEEALALIEQTKAQLTEPSPEVLIWEAVISEQLGLSERAESSLSQAQALINADNEALFWITLGNTRVLAQDLDGGELAAQTALEVTPNEPQALFLLANIAESRGEFLRAVEYYELTFQYAADANPQLAVISRVRLGTLLQTGGGFMPGDAPTATP
jgi:tetratricopeptide (TPR) repeat protein